MWKLRLVVVCAILSSAALVIATLRGFFDVPSAVPGADTQSDGSFGVASSLFPKPAQSRRLVGSNSEGPDHTLPRPSTAECQRTHKLAPTLFIIGFPHSGARSLSAWMNLHSELSYGKQAFHKWHCIPGKDHLRDGNYYVDFFETGCHTKHTFDATPYAYQMAFDNSTQCYFHGATGLKAFEESIGPEHRFIVLLRDPVDRMNSYIRHVKNSERHEDALITADEAPCYAEPLDIWLQVFPRERFLFVKSEELYAQPQNVLNKVFDFAGVARRKYSPSELRYSQKKAVTHRPSMQVRQHYHQSHGSRECVERLQRLTGLEFDWQGLSPEQGLSSAKLMPAPASPACKKLLKPIAFFLGFGHAGTTMLSDLMQAHPELDHGSVKEHDFWCLGPSRALESYYSEFLVSCSTKVAFDGNPMVYEVGAPEGSRSRCRGMGAFKPTLGDPKNKFIVLIRNPVKWMHSHLPDAKVLPLNNYFWNPCYADYLEPFLDAFPREKFLFLRAEDLFADAQPVMDQLFEFLGVGPHRYPPKDASRNVNQHVKSTVSPKEAQRFLDLPRIVECKARLERLTGMEFTWTASN